MPCRFTVITPAADRLARDPTDLLVLAREVQQAGAALRSLAEPYIDTAGDFAEVVLAILGVVAKLERQRILDRTAHGHVAAKARGVRYGRKPKLTPHQRQEALKRREAGEPVREIARSYAVSHSTFHGCIRRPKPAVRWLSEASVAYIRLVRPGLFHPEWHHHDPRHDDIGWYNRLFGQAHRRGPARDGCLPHP